MDLVTVLNHAQNPDASLRSQAELFLNQAIENQYGPFLLALCVEFAADGKVDSNRQLAGIFLKNVVVAVDDETYIKKKNKWLACDAATKEQIRVGLLQSVASPNPIIRNTVSSIIAAFGVIDVPISQWPALIPALLTNVLKTETAVETKIASLQTLGYFCDALESPDDLDVSLSNQILSAIINGLRTDLPDELRAAAITALLNSLDFTSNNFNIDNERDAIMKAVCETTQCAVIDVRIKAFECFAKIAELYYEKLPAYITTIFQLTTAAIKTDDTLVGQQAVEVWITLCDCEMAILDDIDSGILGEDGRSPVILNIVEQAAPALLPFLLEAMTKQSADIDDADEWNIALAAAQCLDFVASTIGDKVVDMVVPFVSANVTNANWRFKDAAITAFGSIAEGATITSGEEGKMKSIVMQAAPVIVTCLQDPTPLVRESAAWTLGRLNEFHSSSIAPELVLPMVSTLAVCLEDVHPKVASRACYAIANLASACEGQREAETNIISQFLPAILQKLFVLANRADGEEENLRMAAFEAVSLLVQNSANDMRGVVGQVLAESLTRLEQANLPTFSAKDRVDTQAILCGVIGECIQRFSTAEAAPYTDRCMQLMLQVLSGQGAAAYEEAFLAMGHVAGKIEGDFIRYTPYVLPPLLAGLKKIEEYSVCATAVGLVDDMARALGTSLTPFCDDIVRSLMELLQSPDLNKTVKPQVISSFADIALAIEDQFEKYAGVVLTILKQASEVAINPESDDDDIVEYVNSLHVAIIEAYSGILQGLKEGGKQDVVLGAIDGIMTFMARLQANPEISSELLKAVVGLLGDLAQTFGRRVSHVFRQPFVSLLVQQGSQDEDALEISQWTSSMITAVL